MRLNKHEVNTCICAIKDPIAAQTGGGEGFNTFQITPTYHDCIGYTVDAIR